MEATKIRPSYDAIVIGAGFSGLYMLYRLRERGLSVRLYEKGGDVGGTWYWNRYPGARCDSEGFYYSYSFSPELDQEWPLIERYPPQPDTLRYLQHVADRFDLRRDIQFDTRVASAIFDESSNVWELHNEDGSETIATFLITAIGCLSTANKPRIKGADTFQGVAYHTSEWPHEHVAFGGKRVGVIGTGSTGIQIIPVIAERAAHLTVFQRTPQFALPCNLDVLEPDFVRDVKATYPELRLKCRESMVGTPYAPSQMSALELTAQERQRAYQAAWDRNLGTRFMGTFNDLVLNKEANDTAADFVRSKIDEIVRDPAVAELLKPTDFPIGTKRPPVGRGYYETFNRPNVLLVDLRKSPIEEITPRGIRAGDTEHKLDMIVYATGFDAMTGSLLAIDIRGRAGTSLKKKWEKGPRTYLGIAMAGFPNLFSITGPGSPSVLTNMAAAIEQHVEWIIECLTFMREKGIKSVEATEVAEDSWTEHVNNVADQTLYPQARSWYMGANIPGKPRAFLPYVGGLAKYRGICDEVAGKRYDGFLLDGQAANEELSTRFN
jgi:cation diffusion facilitator CzcD-associated flavoprotein CzcO